MKISVKLASAFFILTAICILIGIFGWYGSSSASKSVNVMTEKRLPSAFGLGLMMKSLNAIKSNERTMVISSLTADQRKKEISAIDNQWKDFEEGYEIYNSVDRHENENEIWERFQNSLKKWKEIQKELIQLVSDVKFNDIAALESILLARQIDHIKWVESLDRAIIENIEFSGQLDPNLCNFGKWKSTFQSGDSAFDQKLKKIDTPHTYLHELGKDINRIIALNTLTFSGESKEARDLFDTKIIPSLREIELYFSDVLQNVRDDNKRFNTAVEIALGKEKKAFDDCMTQLNNLAELSSANSNLYSRSVKSEAERIKKLSAIIAFLGGFIALTSGYFINRSITTSLNDTIDVIRNIVDGDNNAKLPVGDSVDCSNIKKCGNSDCPSFNCLDHCWIVSGSFASVKHCPRAKKGEDCRTCELYGAKTELYELGSIIASLSNSLDMRRKMAMQIAKGDLTMTVELISNKDKLGMALQEMQKCLSQIISNVQTSGSEISTGAQQISRASQSLAQGATESASSLEEISSSMTELTSQTNMNAENAKKAKEISEEAKEEAKNGNINMKEMIVAMDEINLAGQDISNINKVIDEIAFQTNLLALNAAVEAARAGKYGKGFAVVAEEVRNLAARSSKAAKEIADLIEETVEKTQNGVLIADKSAYSLEKIVEGISNVSEIVAEIAVASENQSIGIAEVSNGILQIDKVTQENTANSEETASASEQLAGQALMLEEMLSKFKLNKVSDDSVSNQPDQPTLLDHEKNNKCKLLKKSMEEDQEISGIYRKDTIVLDDEDFGKY